MIEIQHPEKCKHNFKGAELIEIHALFGGIRWWLDHEMPNEERGQCGLLISLAGHCLRNVGRTPTHVSR
jgi:hypothetical protein